MKQCPLAVKKYKWKLILAKRIGKMLFKTIFSIGKGLGNKQMLSELQNLDALSTKATARKVPSGNMLVRVRPIIW